MALEAEGLNAFFDGYYRHRDFANRQAQEERNAAIAQRTLARMDKADTEYDADAALRARNRQLRTVQADTNLQAAQAAQPGLVAQARGTAATQVAGADQTVLHAVEDAQNAQSIKSNTLASGVQASELQQIDMKIRRELADNPLYAASSELIQRWNAVKAPIDHALATNNMAQANEFGAHIGLEFRTVPGGPGEPPTVQAKPVGSPATAWSEFTDITSVPRYGARVREFERKVQEQTRLQMQDNALKQRLQAATDVARIRHPSVPGTGGVPDATGGATLVPVTAAPVAARAANAAAAPVTASRLKPAPPRTPDESMPASLVGAY
jgi:hypothetical protein